MLDAAGTSGELGLICHEPETTLRKRIVISGAGPAASTAGELAPIMKAERLGSSTCGQSLPVARLASPATAPRNSAAGVEPVQRTRARHIALFSPPQSLLYLAHTTNAVSSHPLERHAGSDGPANHLHGKPSRNIPADAATRSGVNQGRRRAFISHSEDIPSSNIVLIDTPIIPSLPNHVCSMIKKVGNPPMSWCHLR